MHEGPAEGGPLDGKTLRAATAQIERPDWTGAYYWTEDETWRWHEHEPADEVVV